MRWLVGVLVTVAALGCADPCVRAEALNTGFRTTHAECFTGTVAPGSGFDAESCRKTMKACSAAETQAINAYLDCVEQLPVCTDATRQAWSESFLACAMGMSTLSPGCFYP